MRALCAIALLIALPAVAQQEPVADDAFADSDDAFDNAFDDAFADFDEAFDEDDRMLPWAGFVEAAYGRRGKDISAFASRQMLGDLRARLETNWSNDEVRLTFKGEALYDDYESEFDASLRELNVQFSPAQRIDLKAGRQVLTWGTGDLLFLNDLFPKSWVSFFTGRDDEYLKAPSDAIRLTRYGDAVNVDIAWSPRFDPDDYLTGARFSFFSPFAQRIVVPRPPLRGIEPARRFENGELALRVFRTVGSTEYAAYLYRGFFKRPLGLTDTFEPGFPSLSVYGASLRRPLFSGLFNAEFAVHDSRDDAAGTNPLIPNDQFRLLVGYEFEAVSRLTIGLQYYLEATQDYSRLLAHSLAPEFEPDRNRSVVTTRVTYRTGRDRLTLSLFAFVSPSDDDRYLRPSVTYRHSDRWTLTGGANLFTGQRIHTFFGQLKDNSNAWVRVRFNF